MAILNTPPGLWRFNTVSVTFTGASGLGANGSNTTWFTVTGEIYVILLVPYTTLTLTQSGATPTLTLGVTNSTSLFIAATTATTLTTGEFWTEATGAGTANAGSGIPSAITAPTLRDVAVTANILSAVAGGANINGGSLRLDMYWLPLSSDAAVV